MIAPAPPSPPSVGRVRLALVGWLILCFAASGTGVFISTDGWYTGLRKPAWTPPGWLFGPVWMLLYAMMGVAAWLVWREGGWKRQGRALGLFLLQWVLNALWTPLFFGLHLPGPAFAEIVLLWMAIVATVVAFARVRTTAAVLLVPYLIWVTFAAGLNFALWRLNA